MTLQGGRFAFPAGAVIALGGADFESEVEGRVVAPWTTCEVRPGEVLTCGRTRSGARCYLAVRGGIRVPLVLGSASTHVLSGLGGVEGRTLRRGDRLEIGEEPPAPPRTRLQVPAPLGREVFRVTEGPQADRFRAESAAAFYGTRYRVTSDANRMGLRLAGAVLEMTDARELISEGVALGGIQVPAGGQPVILFVEQQTTGGYCKIANVIAADLPALGQLKPGDEIRFQRVDLREARELLYIQERWINAPTTLL